jgi:anthranilate phosphoribosyltransferase
LLDRLISGLDLESGQVADWLEAVVAGRCGDAEAAAILAGLCVKGESGAEIAAAAGVLRRHMRPLDTAGREVLDTCGTGGDGAGTFNISTAAALVAAGAGVPVVKHGNRAVSSRSGSADVLAALGLPVEAGPQWAADCLRRCGFAFCLAPQYHPALSRVSSLRRRLGVRTLFNLLGPLLNPAGAAWQLLGVGRAALLEPMADALARLGVRRALVVYSGDGLDEVSLSGPTAVRSVEAGRITASEWGPGDFGLAACRPDELAADGPDASAAAIRGVLDPSVPEGGARRVVLANAAAALLAAGRVLDLPAGVAFAREAIASGAALAVLDGLSADHISSPDGRVP